MTSAERLKEYENLFKKSQSYNPAQFQQDFEKSYGEATNYNKDLIESRNQAISQAQSLPSQLRQQYYSSPIRNPLAQEALISQQRGAITGDIANQSDLLDARGARYQDILGKQLGMYQTSAEQARTAAENAWRMYQDVLAQEEAERARAEAEASRRAAAAAAQAQAAQLENLFRQNTPTPVSEVGGKPNVYEIPERQVKSSDWTDKVLNAPAQMVLDYRNSSNPYQKYLKVLRDSTLSSVVGGLPGLGMYASAVGPEIWGDVKSGAQNLWSRLLDRNQ
jgi:hypothetical protein